MAIDTNPDVRVYVGPLRDEADLPLPDGGYDFNPASYPAFTEVTAQVAGLEAQHQDGELKLTIDIGPYALSTVTFPPGRQVIVRRRYRALDGTAAVGAYKVWFAGYIHDEQSGHAEGSEAGPVRSGTVQAVQERTYLGLQQMVATVFGVPNLALTKSATAKTTAPDPAADSGIEYVGAQQVDASKAVDGDLSTPWISNTVADPNWPAILDTGAAAKITELRVGRMPGTTVGANGRSTWIEISCNRVVLSDNFESTLGNWRPTRGATVARSTLAAKTGSWSMRIVTPAATEGGGAEVNIGGLTAGVEVEVSFWTRCETGTFAAGCMVTGEGGNHYLDYWLTTTWDRKAIRVKADRNGTINIRFSTPALNKAYYVDDVVANSGIRLHDNGFPYRHLWLVWNDGNGNSNYSAICDDMGIDVIPPNRPIILVDDADLFRSEFDPGDSEVKQWREVPWLRTMDFASGRGTLQLQWYPRWPDLNSGAQTWDSISLVSPTPSFSATQSLVRTAFTGASQWVVQDNPAPGGTAAYGTAWLRVDLGTFNAATLIASMDAVTLSLQVQVTTTEGYAAYGYGYVENERVYLARVNGTTWQVTRTAPVAHAAGAGVYPELGGQRVTLPLYSGVGIRRLPGTPRVVDFDIIGSIVGSPGMPDPTDPAYNSVAAGGKTWGAHPDWFTIVTVRNNQEWSNFYLNGQREGSVVPVTWPPAAGFSQPFGKQLRWIMVVIHKMERWQTQPQRAKLNELVVLGTQLDSGQAGAWSSRAPADLRGVVGYVLTQVGGLTPARVRMDNHSGPNLPYGSYYGSLTTAQASAWEVITSLCKQGLLTVFCEAGNYVNVAPDPLSTSAGWTNAVQTWDATNMTGIDITRQPTDAVSQVIINARNPALGISMTAAYPRVPLRYGAIVTYDEILLGDQNAVENLAITRFRQARAGYAVTITTVADHTPDLYTRHLVNYPAADLGGVDLANRNFLLTGYGWSARRSETGTAVVLTLTLEELTLWS